MKSLIRIISFVCALIITNSSYASSLSVPSRIVSMNLCTDELLLRLADRQKIAAITQFSSKPSSSAVYDEVKDIPKIQGEIEEVMAYRPDLVVASVFTNRETIEMLKRLKVPTVVLKVPANFDEIYENIKILGKELGEEKKANELIEKMKRELANLKLDQNKKMLRAVFYQSGGNVPGLKTFQDSIFNQVGFKNLAEELGMVGHNRVPLERLIFTKPDVLIMVDIQKKKTFIGGELLFHPALKKGLQGTKVVTLPSKYLHCGAPSSVEAVKMLREQVLKEETSNV